MAMKQGIRQNIWKAVWLAAVATLATVGVGPAAASCPDKHWACGNGSDLAFGTCISFPSGCKVCNSNWQDGCRRRDVRCDNGETPAARRDGCSGGRSNDLSFKPACDEHDTCYSTPGRSKASCDSEFLANMNTLCATFAFGGLGVCQAEAQVYYQAVRSAPQAQDGYNAGQAWAARVYCGLPPVPRKLVFSRKPGSSSQIVSYWAGSALPQGGGGPVPAFVNPPQPAWIDLPPGGEHTIEYTRFQPIGLQKVFFNIIKNNDKTHAVCVVSAELFGDGTLMRATSNCPSSITVTTNHNDVVVSLPLQL